MKFTHKGWFGFCPVYFADIDSIAPLVHERHWIFMPAMILNEWIFGAMFFILTLANPDYIPEWPLKITGELPEHKK